MSVMSSRFRPLVLATGLLAAVSSAQAQSAGDLMFTSFNTAEDGWSMVALADLAANTTVFFNDNEWTGSAFNGGESFHRWSTGGSTIAAGTVIRFSAIDKTTLAASVGTLARESVSGSTNYGISNGSETVYAYLGTNATTPTTFLSAINHGGFDATNGVLTSTGLVTGTNAITFPANTGFAQYTGPRSGYNQFSDYAALVVDPANWTRIAAGNAAVNAANAALIPNTTDFSVQPIPEPSELAMMVAGFGLAGLIARRRRSAR
jgi:hypothetical protein